MVPYSRRPTIEDAFHVIQQKLLGSGRRMRAECGRTNGERPKNVSGLDDSIFFNGEDNRISTGVAFTW